jgi:excisionase family DNA binding protein
MAVVMEERPALLKPSEAAALLNVSRSKVYALVAAGHLPAVRLTGSIRIPRGALMALLDSATVWPDAPMRYERTAPVAQTRTAPEVGRVSDRTTAGRS